MSANPEPICGDSCDLSIYNGAGFEEMLKARQEIGPLATGEVAVSPAFALPAKYVFHTVGPVWKGGSRASYWPCAPAMKKIWKKRWSWNANPSLSR